MQRFGVDFSNKKKFNNILNLILLLEFILTDDTYSGTYF